jgi:hypothetical protein
VKQIPLRARDGSVRDYALVDDDVFEELGSLRWSLHSQGYAYRQAPGLPRRNVLLHRAVMGLEYGDRREIDHENRNRLDCRRENLRITDRAGNAQNIVARRGARSRFRAVSWKKDRGRWQVIVGGRWVGLFDDELDAAIAAEARRRETMPFALPDPELVKALAELEAAA